MFFHVLLVDEHFDINFCLLEMLVDEARFVTFPFFSKWFDTSARPRRML